MLIRISGRSYLLISEAYNRDCLLAMAEMPDKAFDLAIVDPPYGIGADKKNAHSNIRDNDKWKSVDWDAQVPTEQYFRELKRVSTNQIIWGGNYFLDFLPSTQCFLVWDKGARDFSLADAELAWTSFNTSVRIQTIHRCQLQLEGNKFHPTQKPIRLYKWLLTNYAKPGDRILDSHMGSQSSRIACWDLGFDYVGFEIDEDYYKAGCERFERHKAQGKLFAPIEPEVKQNDLFSS